MRLSRLRLLAVFFAASAATALGYQHSPVNRPWPPPVQTVSGQSPVLSPEEALKTFYMPPGYRVELVAAEPLVQEPVALDWDTEGRLWVVEMPGWMPDITAAGEHDPIGRVVVLQDRNGDGRMDARTVFADGLVLARSLKILDRGVLVGEPPNVWFMQDTDGDLRADTKELVTNQYGHRDVDPQNNANGFHWSLDNRMYTAGQSDIQLRLKNGKFTVHHTLRRGEWGVTHDDGGRIYRNTNESALHVDLVQTAYYARNPNVLRTRGSYERLATGNEDLNIVWPVRPNPGTNRAYQTGIDRPDGTLAKFTAVCAPVVYRGDRLPADLYGNVFVAEPAANLVSRLVLEDDGTTLWARKAYEKGEFLASTDERFRPVFISNAPDGTLYIADLYRGIIEHRISITMYLRDQIVARKLEQPTGLGRIYRVVHDTTRRDTARRPTGWLTQLVGLLTHPNGWWRDTAQRLLVERGVRTAAPALVELAAAKDPRTRLHALWTLDGLDAIEPATVTRALEDPARDVRASAIRIAERWLAEANHPVQAAVMKRLDDRDWWVRQQLAASVGVMPAGVREAAAASVLERYGDDPVVVDAAISGLRGSEAAVLARMLEGAGVRLKPDATEEIRTANAVTMLAATIVRSAQDAAIQNLFAWIGADTRAEWQRSALLRGAEVALLGASMPARPSVRKGTTETAAKPSAPLPCPTCPGGRAGPGGAYAFARSETPARPGGRGGSRGLRLAREPAALTALGARADDLGSRAAKLLARVSWPGKPGAPAPVAPLTADEQRRYDAGQEVYRNVCQSCHQPDGRGQDRIAPSLVDSTLALASPEIPARILLNGKEGSFGLMPPIGAALSDDQLAAVLTYIRREWGQTGTAVDPETVKTVRAATAGRTRPWTEEELKALGTVQEQPWPPEGVLRPGQDGVLPPRLVSDVKPQYTERAMRAKIQGRVVIECVVAADGTVQDTRVVRSLDREHGLDEAALAALKQWRFTPATRNGAAVPVVVSVELGFSLKGLEVLAWPTVFSKTDPGASRQWTEATHDASDLRIRVAYPAGWEVHRDFKPTRLMLVHNPDGTRMVDVSQPAPAARSLANPLTPAQLEQSIEMLKTRVAERGLQLVDAGQVRVANRLWIWHEARVPTFDPARPPVEMSVVPGGTPGSARTWVFTTTEQSQMVLVFCTVLYRQGMSPADMEAQTRAAGADFAAVLERISIDAIGRLQF